MLPRYHLSSHQRQLKSRKVEEFESWIQTFQLSNVSTCRWKALSPITVGGRRSPTSIGTAAWGRVRRPSATGSHFSRLSLSQAAAYCFPALPSIEKALAVDSRGTYPS